MSVEKAQKYLTGLYKSIGRDLVEAKKDIKPSYGINITDHGYPYIGIEEMDKDFIYSSISKMYLIINDHQYPFSGDLLHLYITEKKAAKAVFDLLKDLQADFDRLNALKEKYTGKSRVTPHPIQVCLDYSEHIIGVLNDVLTETELKKYVQPSSEQEREDEKVPEQSYENVDIAIITALYDTEFETLSKIDANFVSLHLPNDATKYMQGNIGNKSVIIATDDKMGMSASTALAMKVLSRFKPKYIMMAGIAAGIKDKERNYGDLLIARYIWNYDSGKYKYDPKTKQTIFQPHPEQIELDEDIVRMLNDVKADSDVFENIRNSFPVNEKNLKPNVPPKIVLDPMASGSAVISAEHKVAEIKRNNRKLIGIDMEIYGLFYAAKSFAYLNKPIALAVKSLSDYADHRKNDRYRMYAAHTSAQFIYHFILSKLQ